MPDTLLDVALRCAKQIGRVDASGATITDLAAEIKEEIGNAITSLNRYKWHLTEVRDFTLTTVADTTFYSTVDLSAGTGEQAVSGRTALAVTEIVSIDYGREEVGSSGLREPLRQISYRELERLREGTNPASTPEYFARYAGQIGLWPTPGSVQTITFSGKVKPVVPTGDSESSVWFDRASELVECEALKRVCQKYLRDTQRALEFGVMAQGLRNELSSEWASQRATGRLRVND